MSTAPRVHREVVSYVRRSTRMNPSQHKAWTTLRSGLVVDVPTRETTTSIAPDAHVDWVAAFGRAAPLIVEIGSGTGDSLVAVAAAHPEHNVVAFEVYSPAVASAMARVNREGLGNVRFVVADGAEGLARLFGPGSITELHTFFPDPWHKKRHHKRRLVNRRFADLVADRLVPEGRWRIATDWADYAAQIRDLLDHHSGLLNLHQGWAPRWPVRPITRFEERGLAAGRPILDLTYAARR